MMALYSNPWPGIDEEYCRRCLHNESTIYTTLGTHDRLVRMIEYSNRGLRLQYMSNGNLKDYLGRNHDTSISQRTCWASQAAEAVQLLHNHKLIHCDVKLSNFLVGQDLNLRIIDFAFSVSMDSSSWSCESPRFYLPRPQNGCASVASDIFALGCTIYQIMTGKIPLEGIASDEVERLYNVANFQDLVGVPHEALIRKCFLCEIYSAQEVHDWLQIFDPWDQEKLSSAGYTLHHDGSGIDLELLSVPIPFPSTAVYN